MRHSQSWGCEPDLGLGSGAAQEPGRQHGGTDGEEWHIFRDIDGTSSLTARRGGSGFTRPLLTFPCGFASCSFWAEPNPTGSRRKQTNLCPGWKQALHDLHQVLQAPVPPLTAVLHEALCVPPPTLSEPVGLCRPTMLLSPAALFCSRSCSRV